MRRQIQLALLGTASALLAARAGAQGVPAPAGDEGILIVTRGDAVVGREAFRVARGANGGALYTLTGTVSYGTRRLTPALSTDASGMPLIYQVELTQGSSVEESLRASGRPGRLSAMSRRAGGESAREYVLPGRALVLDDEVFHQYVLVPLAQGGTVSVVVPRRRSQVTGRVESHGEESITVDGKPVTASHWTLALPDGAREVWVDGAGRLLRVRAGGLTATREELPR